MNATVKWSSLHTEWDVRFQSVSKKLNKTSTHPQQEVQAEGFQGLTFMHHCPVRSPVNQGAIEGRTATDVADDSMERARIQSLLRKAWLIHSAKANLKSHLLEAGRTEEWDIFTSENRGFGVVNHSGWCTFSCIRRWEEKDPHLICLSNSCTPLPASSDLINSVYSLLCDSFISLFLQVVALCYLLRTRWALPRFHLT